MGDAIVNFTLSQESYLAEEVVSATRANSKMPIAQTTLGAEQIAELKKGFDIPYLLEMLPSVVYIGGWDRSRKHLIPHSRNGYVADKCYSQWHSSERP